MPYSRDRDPSNREFYDAITPRPITGIQEAANEMAAIKILADRLADVRDAVARMAASQEALVTALNTHILHCSQTHGPLGPVLENLIRQVTSNGRLHDAMETRLRVVEDRDTAEGAQRLHDRVRELEAAKVEADKKIVKLAAETAAELAKRDKAQAAELAVRDKAQAERDAASATERKIWGRIIPALIALITGGGAAIAAEAIKGVLAP